MSEVRTDPVKARFVHTDEEFFNDDMKGREPGLILRGGAANEAGDEYWHYSCPCGCGACGGLRVRAGAKPEESPSWYWNGSEEEAVLSPSVYHIGHWHGWLGGSGGERPGWWISV